MALIECPECGKMISDKAEHCPNCGFPIQDFLNENKQEEESIEKLKKHMQVQYEQIDICAQEESYRLGEKLCEELVRKIEETKAFLKDSNQKCYDFGDMFQMIIFDHIYNQVQNNFTYYTTEISYSRMYTRYGFFLNKNGKNEEAIVAFKKALIWNPVDAFLLIRIARAYKDAGNLDLFWNYTKQAFKYAYTEKSISACYANIGLFLFCKQEYFMSCFHYVHSIDWGGEIDVLYAFDEARKHTDTKENFTDEYIDELFKKYDIPTGPSIELLKLAFDFANMGSREKEKEMAIYFLNIAKILAKEDEEYIKEIEKK